MPDLTVMSAHVGDVVASEEVVELLGVAMVDTAVGHLRLGGGRCWACHGKIHHTDDVSLVVHETAAGGKVGFVHFRCGPPQLIDNRRNRRAAIAMDRYLKERSTDAQAFVVARNYPSPHGMLVVSPEVGPSVIAENGELLNPWLDLSLTAGFAPLAPDVLDAAPDTVEGWNLRMEGSSVVCEAPGGRLFDGRLETPEPWLDAVISERRCVVLVAGISVDSNVLGRGFELGLNLLASKGLVAGGTVEVKSLLGLHTALGVQVAEAEARKIRKLTGTSRAR